MANSPNLAYCLENSEHQSEMLEAFYEYLRDESMVDVMLSCDGSIIKAHKVVLSAGSPYFRNIFQAFKNPCQLPVIVIKDMPFRDLKSIVEFLYRGQIVVPAGQMDSLTRSARTLFITGLEKYSNNSMRVNVAESSTRTTADTRTDINGPNARVNERAPLQTRNLSPTQSNQRKRNSTSSQANRSNAVHNSAVIAPKPSIKIKSNQNSISKPKPKSNSKVVNTSNDSKTTSMRLRNTRRPDYRQLSNGDFIESDDSVHEIDFNQIDSKLHQTSRTYSKADRNQSLLKREIGMRLGTDDDQDEELVGDQTDEDELNNHFIVNQNDMDVNDLQSTSMPSEERITTGFGLPHNSRVTECYDSFDDPLMIETNPETFWIGPIYRKSIRPPQTGPLHTSTPNHLKPDPRAFPIKAESVPHLRCSLCPRMFANTVGLNFHIRRIHNQQKGKHVCQTCGKEYSWPSGLYKHMRVHKS